MAVFDPVAYGPASVNALAQLRHLIHELNELSDERFSQLIVVQEAVLHYVLTESTGSERQEVVTL